MPDQENVAPAVATVPAALFLPIASTWDSPIKVDKRKTLVHNMEEV